MFFSKKRVNRVAIDYFVEPEHAEKPFKIFEKNDAVSFFLQDPDAAYEQTSEHATLAEAQKCVQDRVDNYVFEGLFIKKKKVEPEIVDILNNINKFIPTPAPVSVTQGDYTIERDYSSEDQRIKTKRRHHNQKDWSFYEDVPQRPSTEYKL